MTDFKSVAVTIRPKDGVTNDHILKFSKWVSRNTQYNKIVTEKEGCAKHIHASLFFEKPRNISNLRKLITNLYPDLTPQEKIILRQGVKPQYNIDWLEYLDKDDSTVVISSNLPERQYIHQYFPTPLESTKKRRNNTYYGRLEMLWQEHVEPGIDPNPPNCRDFLFKMMYSLRVLDVIKDDRAIVQVSRHLSRFLQKMETSVIEINSCYEKDE